MLLLLEGTHVLLVVVVVVLGNLHTQSSAVGCKPPILYGNRKEPNDLKLNVYWSGAELMLGTHPAHKT